MSSASCDDSSGVNFSYTPLRPEKSEIRLLRAQPGELDAEIQPFDLHNISLNDYPSYIALSYTWGDPTPREIIYVNGKALLVTENLSRILKRAKEFEGSYFWVDGICINQADIPERSCQVDAMPRIYSSAVKVVAFIGDAPDAVAGAARKLFMDPFLDCKTDEEFKVRSTDIREGRYKDTEASIEEVLEQWCATIKVNSQPWFNRCWIVQEVLLAKEVEIWFGNMSFPMRNLYYGRESAWEYRLKSYGMETVFALQDHSTTINMDIALANLNNVHTNKLLVAWTEWSERKDGRNTLFRLLQRFGGRSTTDARDRIYGLLGLASEKDQAAILPDYSELNKPSAVFRTVASHIIRTYEDPLEILYFASPPYDQTSKRPAHLLRGYERVSAHLSDILAGFGFSGIHAPLELLK
ncbi:HET-domain-containing protein [Hyaloscypha variabilis F]|uniref:HET-domain-containing protein n=1 Tax=Hyaloscypha variabilis (strain UAMH 11265 / GT02V1 / F) TaxID=1149755 RepID=A0A2J6QZR3_HYAVF|nr:HET-domain-containing protein [Hyaloscypha variabilis F]